MKSITLEQINKNIIELRKEIVDLKEYIREDFELADYVKRDILESRKRLKSSFIKHENVVKRYS